MLFKHKLNLASGSPRRHELVGYLYNNTAILRTECEEPKWQKPLKPGAYLELCLGAKWGAAQLPFAATKPKNGEYLLVADTIVVLGSDVLGKPEDPKNAVQMLSRLSGKDHEVWTGYKIGKWTGIKFLFEEKHIISQVLFRKLSKKEILDYVKSREPMDKAGAYGFQGIGIQNIKAIKGSYTNIVGLPLFELRASTLRLEKIAAAS